MSDAKRNPDIQEPCGEIIHVHSLGREAMLACQNPPDDGHRFHHSIYVWPVVEQVNGADTP